MEGQEEGKNFFKPIIPIHMDKTELGGNLGELIESQYKQEFVKILTEKIKKIQIGSTPSQIMRELREFKYTISTTINEQEYNLTIDLNSFGNSEFNQLRPIWVELDSVLAIWQRIWLAKLKKQGKDISEGYEINPYTGEFYPTMQIVACFSGVHGDEWTTPNGVSRLLSEIIEVGKTGFYKTDGMYFNHLLNQKALDMNERGFPFDFNRVDEAMEDPKFRETKAEIEDCVDSFNDEESIPKIILDFHNAPSVQESQQNPEIKIESCIERPYMLVSYNPNCLVEGDFLEHPEVKRMVDMAKSLGISDLKFCPEQPFAKTLAGSIEQEKKDTNPIKSIFFEFPQTTTQGSMSNKEFEELQYQERYLSTATMAKAMLLFRGLQSDSQEPSFSLPLQLQFIAGSVDFPEAKDEVNVKIIELEGPLMKTTPENQFFKFQNMQMGEDGKSTLILRQNSIKSIQQLQQNCLSLAKNSKLVTNSQGLEYLELDSPIEYLQQLSQSGYILHGSPYLFENINIKAPDENDSEKVGRDMISQIYGSYTDWLTPCFMAFSKRSKDGGGQINCGIKANITNYNPDQWDVSYDFPNSKLQLTNPSKEAFVYVLDPFYFQRNPNKDNPLEWTSKNQVEKVAPIIRVKLTAKDLNKLQSIVEFAGGNLVINQNQ